MTRDEAITEAERRQREDPDAKWLATQRGDEWIVARVGLGTTPIKPTGTAVQAPPLAPHDVPQSDLQRITTQFGSPG
jgi:hypothetical protein